jgi:uncharacterized protein (TIGR02231 family)
VPGAHDAGDAPFVEGFAMRKLIALLLITTAAPALADTIEARSTITAVTVYPDGAKITREVSFALPSAGSHDLLVLDLPRGMETALMQLEGSAGLNLGGFALRDDRLPPRDVPDTPEQVAAKAALDDAKAAERAALAAVEAVQARIAAANAQGAFLTSFSGALPDTATPETLKAMAEMVGAETLAAAQAAAAAKADLWASQEALETAQKARADAQAALEALPRIDKDYLGLSVEVEAAAAGDGKVTLTHYIEGAGWRPFYELDLTRAGTPALSIDRAVLVTQYTGEDWAGVDLTLSTSRPADQAAPSMLWPELRQIVPEGETEDYARDAMTAAGIAPPEAVIVMDEAEPVTAAAGLEGDTVVYHYPRTVDVASGVEDLRLPLDVIEAQPVVYAQAVPRWDRNAFVMAEFVNPGQEPLLPGDALLFREGVLVGQMALDLIAPGAEAEIAFGALETIRVKREMPVRDSGQSGFLTTSNEASEAAVLTVENLGTESWPLRVLDQVPYSEQEDLEITLDATPAPDATDVDGQRGILEWSFDLGAGEKREISLTYAMRWPEGMDLR